MSTLTTTNYLDIIERLPAGAKLQLFHVDWKAEGQTATLKAFRKAFRSRTSS